MWALITLRQPQGVPHIHGVTLVWRLSIQWAYILPFTQIHHNGKTKLLWYASTTVSFVAIHYRHDQTKPLYNPLPSSSALMEEDSYHSPPPLQQRKSATYSNEKDNALLFSIYSTICSVMSCTSTSLNHSDTITIVQGQSRCGTYPLMANWHLL